MAERLGKHLHELMGWDGPMTNRQFLAWDEWQFNDLNEPHDLIHHELVKLIAEVRQKLNKRAVKIKDCKPKFVRGKAQKVISKEEKTKMVKAAWLHRIGVSEDDIYVDEEGRTRIRTKKQQRAAVERPRHRSNAPKPRQQKQ